MHCKACRTEICDHPVTILSIQDSGYRHYKCKECGHIFVDAPPPKNIGMAQFDRKFFLPFYIEDIDKRGKTFFQVCERCYEKHKDI